MKVLFLGTGGSSGVPVIDCSCKVCSSSDEKNTRLRSSALLMQGKKSFLIDAGPDFRQQALLHKMSAPNAIFLTHTHYDHAGGLDEFRAFGYHKKTSIPCFLSTASFESLQKTHYYLFSPHTEGRNRTAEFDFHVLDGDVGEFLIDDCKVQYVAYVHGGMPVLGFRIGSLAYITDLKEYDEKTLSFLHGVEFLITSATCLKHSHLHQTVEEAVSFAKKTGAKQTYFTHLSHEIDYAYVSSLLPQGMFLAYDGLDLLTPESSSVHP